MKGMGLDENMSKLTSTTISNETSFSSYNNINDHDNDNDNNNNNNDNDNDTTVLYVQQASSSSFASQPYQSQTPAKKKRSLPGNPDPKAEVIALSPKSLLATNRFICEICKKGFQRDQNLQLHRRGHNLPWKLKQRANKDVIIKKVYVCPESTCVHHHPSRALGDLTGIKKHFCRKHGEKKWNCHKCCKKYAVQSDWKAHSKICGTREYSCHCGTLFSRRDSFITHRAFCDALAEESAISINPQSTTNLSSLTHHHQAAMVSISTTPTSHISLPPHNFTSHQHTLLQSFPIKKEQEDQHASNNMDSIMRQDVPLWLACPPPPPSQQPQPQPQPPAHDHSHHSGSSSSTSPALRNHQAQLSAFQAQYNNQNQNQNQNQNHQQNAPTLNAGPTLSSFQVPLPSHAHMSATALLQRVAQMGVTIRNPQQYNNQQQQQEDYHCLGQNLPKVVFMRL